MVQSSCTLSPGTNHRPPSRPPCPPLILPLLESSLILCPTSRLRPRLSLLILPLGSASAGVDVDDLARRRLLCRAIPRIHTASVLLRPHQHSCFNSTLPVNNTVKPPGCKPCSVFIALDACTDTPWPADPTDEFLASPKSARSALPADGSACHLQAV